LHDAFEVHRKQRGAVIHVVNLIFVHTSRKKWLFLFCYL